MAGISDKVYSIWVDKYLSNYPECGQLSNASQGCFFYFRIKNSNGEFISPNNYVFPSPLKNSALLVPNVTVSEMYCKPFSLLYSKNFQISDIQKTTDSQEFVITISTDAIALFVWIETEISGLLSENGFLLVQSLKNVTFHADVQTNTEELKRSMTVVNLLHENFL